MTCPNIHPKEGLSQSSNWLQDDWSVFNLPTVYFPSISQHNSYPLQHYSIITLLFSRSVHYKAVCPDSRVAKSWAIGVRQKKKKWLFSMGVVLIIIKGWPSPKTNEQPRRVLEAHCRSTSVHTEKKVVSLRRWPTSCVGSPSQSKHSTSSM